MNPASPTISVVLPVYNGEQYIDLSIDSILRQSFADFELVIVNDGSVDRTQELVELWCAKDDRIKLYNQPNRGLVYALAKGLELARGRYVARIDADDLMTENRLAEQLALLESNPKVAVVGSWMDVIDENGTYLTTWELPVSAIACDYWTYLNADTRVGHPAVMYRTDLAKSIGGYRVIFDKLGEDVDLWFRFELAGYSVVNLPQRLTSYRLHANQSTKKDVPSIVESRYRAIAYYLSSKLNREVSVRQASLMLPSNYTSSVFLEQQDLSDLYMLKQDMFRLFVQKNNLGLKDLCRYALQLWFSLLPLRRLPFTNPFRVIMQNTQFFFRVLTAKKMKR